MKKIILIILLSSSIFPQQTPLEKNNFQKLTSYEELTKFVKEIDNLSDLLSIEVIGKSVEGRILYALKFSDSDFGNDTSKIKVLIFAQQHGNEQSGKEGTLLLARELIKPELRSLFQKIDLAIIPQMNPDGSEVDVRQNANGMDLNRNHIILTEPETIALHKLFDEYLFEATMDVHEYYPYSDSWMDFGYIKNFDEQIGTTTNPNVSEKIRNISNNEFLPFIEGYLNERGFTFHNYLLGGPPGVELFRHSTYDINDGRQGFGILNSFSFIMEGKNGRDSIDNIQRRAEGQMHGMLGFLGFISTKKDEIKSLVKNERAKLLISNFGEKVAVQFDHVSEGKQLNLQLQSLFSGSDTVVQINDYRSIVKSIYDVERPLGYLIPKKLNEIVGWAKRQNLIVTSFDILSGRKFQQYFISQIDSINFEGDTIINPITELKEVTEEINKNEFLYIPTNQLKNNLIVIALEPKSMLGLATYKEFEYLIKAGEYYPILRVVPE